MLSAGKHVVCEKPLGMNVKETQEMVELAHKQKLFLMEAIWSRCLPSYKKVKELLERGIPPKSKYSISCWTEFGNLDPNCLLLCQGPAYTISLAIFSGAIGDVILAESSFGRIITSDRMIKQELGGGTTLDLGVYCIQFSTLAFNTSQ